MAPLFSRVASESLCQIVTPVGMLGYGFEENELDNGLSLGLKAGAPTAIILDSGSTDSGPAKLALGTTTVPRSSYVRDLRKLITRVKSYRVPLIISSAGGDGSDAHVKEFLAITSEILSTPGEEAKLKVIAIYSGVAQQLVLKKLETGKISGCGPCVPSLTAQDVETTSTIVGQMGPEPFLQAMSAHPDFDIIIGGRAYDPAPYVAWCAFHQLERQHQPILSLDSQILGGFTHMGKIMECGGLCATPKSRSAMATVYADGVFDIRPLSPGAICTPLSVAAHTLYEKAQPDKLHGPGGFIDLSATTYTAAEDGISIRVQGTVFNSSKEQGKDYTIKLEGAKVVGYRSIFMGSFVDPILISQLDSFLRSVKAYVNGQHQGSAEGWKLDFHIYGQDRISLKGSGNPSAASQSVFVVGEALAESQELARSLVSAARVACLHGPYQGQKATGGNFGMGIGGMNEIDTGPCAEFSIYHLMELDQGDEEASEVCHEMIEAEDKIKHPRKLFHWDMVWIGTGSLESSATPLVADVNGHNSEAKSNGHTVDSPTIKHIGTLGDSAKVIRSKNAGPYEITFDVMFNDKALYERIKMSGALTTQCIADLYNISTKDIVYCGFFDPAMAFKVTIPRMRNGKPVAAGGYMEDDVHGSQKYLPLMNMRLDIDL